MFWVISVYFSIRNTLPKSGTFLLGHPVYVHLLVCQLNKLQNARCNDKDSEIVIKLLFRISQNVVNKTQQVVLYTGLFKMIIGVLTTCHTQLT